MFSHIALIRGCVVTKTTRDSYLLVDSLYMRLQVSRPCGAVMTLATKMFGALVHSFNMLLQILSVARLESAMITAVDIVLVHCFFVRFQMPRSCGLIITLVTPMIP